MLAQARGIDPILLAEDGFTRRSGQAVLEVLDHAPVDAERQHVQLARIRRRGERDEGDVDGENLRKRSHEFAEESLALDGRDGERRAAHGLLHTRARGDVDADAAHCVRRAVAVEQGKLVRNFHAQRAADVDLLLDLDCAALLDGAQVVAHQACRHVGCEQIGRGLADDVPGRHPDEHLERPVHEQVATGAILRVDERVGRVVQNLLQAHLGVAQARLRALQVGEVAQAQQYPPALVHQHRLDVDDGVDGLAVLVLEPPLEPLRQTCERALQAPRRRVRRRCPVRLGRRRKLERVAPDQRLARATEQAAGRVVAILDDAGDDQDAEVGLREQEPVGVAVAGELAQRDRAGLGRHGVESR